MMDEPDRSSEPPGRSSAAEASGTALRVELRDATTRLTGSDRAWLDGACARVASVLAARFGARGELRVRVVDDGEMSAAHARWSGDPSTTDVLTFDLSGRAPEVDADVYACLDEAERQARERGHGHLRELLLYVLHAALHCLGHDDGDETSYRRMHETEDQVLEAAGIGATFGAVGTERAP